MTKRRLSAVLFSTVAAFANNIVDSGKNNAHQKGLQKGLGDNSKAFITQNVSLEGARVADLGCGNGYMACWLAQQVGPSGVVYAVDRRKEALESVAQRAESLGLTNVVCLQGHLESLEGLIPESSLDLVYHRMALIHSSNPEKTMTGATAFLKKGGYLISEEPSFRKIVTTQDQSLGDRLLELFMVYPQQKKLDYVIGTRLKELFEGNGITVAAHNTTHQMTTGKDAKSCFTIIFKVNRGGVVPGHATEQDIDQLLERLEAMPDESIQFLYHMVQVAGQKS